MNICNTYDEDVTSGLVTMAWGLAGDGPEKETSCRFLMLGLWTDPHHQTLQREHPSGLPYLAAYHIPWRNTSFRECVFTLLGHKKNGYALCQLNFLGAQLATEWRREKERQPGQSGREESER
ncbi:hypothetical protein CDAR_84381, partial [Caerostris darwini]